MTGTSSVQTKIVLLINVVLTAVSASLYTYWKVKVNENNFGKSGEYIYYSVVVWFSFGNVFGDVITTFACRSSSSWKYWDMSYIIHCICYIILYIIGASLLAKEVSDIDKSKEVFALTKFDICEYWKCDMMKGCVVIGFLIVVVSVVELFYHYKDHKANKDDC